MGLSENRVMDAETPIVYLTRRCLLEKNPPYSSLNPVYSFSRQISTMSAHDSSCTSTARKLLQSSWTVYKHITSLVKMEKLLCESKKETLKSPVLNTRSTDIMSKLLAQQQQVTREDIEEFISNEDPWDRVRRMFAPNDITVGPSVQLMRLKVSIRLCLFTSFTYFFYQGVQSAKTDFKKKYALAVFATKSVAQSRRYRHLVSTGFNRAGKMTFKMSLFVLPILISHHVLEVYWNKTSPLTIIVPTGVLGCLWKISLGPKGMFAGAVIGTAFGGVAGMLWFALAKLSHETQEEINYESVRQLLKIKRNYTLGREKDYREEVDDLD